MHHLLTPRLVLVLLFVFVFVLVAPCLLAASALATPGPCQQPQSRPATRKTTHSHPLGRDRTGIRWVHPFRKALAKAKAEGRLLLFLPLAGGTNHKGDW